MKRTCLILWLLISFSVLWLPRASAQERMRVNLSDGSVIEVAIDDIRKLTFDLTTDLAKPTEWVQQFLKVKTYPNPAREYLNIDYSLAAKGEVVLEIYSLGGNQLLNRTFGDQPAGQYQYRWNTTDVPSGMYICRIRQNSQIVSEKIIVKK